MVTDITHLLDEERGTAFDQDTILFANFGDGSVFNYDDLGHARSMKEMLEQDAKAQTLEQVLTLPIRSADFNIFQGEARTEVYERIHRILSAPANAGGMTTPMNLVIAQMCNAIVYKKAFFEKVWVEDQESGGVKYGKIAWRPSSTCAVERDPKTGAFRGFRQMPVRLDDTDEERFAPDKAFVYIHGTHRDPMEGVSDLTITHWCWKTKQKIRFLWYQFLEGQSLPKTIVKAADPTEAVNAAKKLVGLRQGGIVGLSDKITHEVLESSGRGADQFKAAIQWLDGEASSSVLAGFTDLGAAATSGTGSFALSKDQTDFFLMSRKAESREMEDYINQYLIADLVRWNFGPNERAPMFKFGPISREDATSAISLLQATAQTPVEQSALPREFFDELAEKVAGLLGMNVRVVREGILKKAAEAKQRAEAMATAPGNAPGVAEAMGAVEEAERIVRGAPRPGGNAPSNALQQQVEGVRVQ